MHAFKRALNYFFRQRSIKGTESVVGAIISSKSFQIFARLVAYGSTRERIVIEIALTLILENY